MTISHRAEINPSLLVWARKNSRMDISYAAKKLDFSEQKLISWESGNEQPTIKQLRKIAKIYRVNFGVFFLPEPPVIFTTKVQDFRRYHGSTFSDFSPEIYIDLRSNINTRDIAIELEEDMGIQSQPFQLTCSIDESPSDAAKRIRNYFGITFAFQKTFKDTRIAFNTWREKLSSVGCLVLQSTKIDLGEMRGYSVFYDVKPIVVVNRKDPYSARTFTLLHELVHLMLHSSGLCDLHANTNMPAHEQKLEVFCNHVAAQALVPDEYLLSYSATRSTDSESWTDAIVGPIARDFGVSREVILRRLLDHGLTTRSFYEENRERFRQEVEISKKRSKGGFVTPAVDAISSKGKPFVSLVVDAMNSSVITQSDASDYLGVKAKHFAKIELAVEG